MQTLEVGRPLQSSFGKLGGRVGHAIAPLQRIRALFVGYPGCGKSCLIQSHPKAFIENIDCSSTTTYTPKAAIWPFIDPATGTPCDDDGSPCILTWEKIEAKHAILKEMAKANDPNRPETIVIDSVTGLLPLLRDYLTRKAGKTAFKELHGPTAYDDMYSILVNTLVELHAYGYGVFLIAHVMDYSVTVDDKGGTKQIPDINFTEGLANRLYDKLELIALVEKRTAIVKKQDPRYPNDPRKTIDETVEVPYLTRSPSAPTLARYIKSRVPFNPIQLPQADAWATVEAEYNRARASVASQGVSK